MADVHFDHICFFSDVGIYDRVVIQELIKTIAQTRQINSTEQRSFKGEYEEEKIRCRRIKS